jgi:hypothetical protein
MDVRIVLLVFLRQIRTPLFSKFFALQGVKWQLEAALLSTPADLSALVSVSLTNGDAFLEDDTLHRMVKLLLNENTEASEQHTKLDVLTILANLAKSPMKHVKGEVGVLIPSQSSALPILSLTYKIMPTSKR